MTKVQIYTITGTKSKELDLPKQFNEPVRRDLIKKASMKNGACTLARKLLPKLSLMPPV